MTKLGELLKSEREKRSLSLHEIGMSLKINPKILKAIEDGDQANLPAKTFLRGFVKSYAQYLRIDPNEALQMFQDEYGATRLEPIPPVQQPPAAQAPPQQPQGVPRYESSLKRPEDSALPVANNNRLYTILFAILLLTLIAFVAKMMDKYQKESRDAKPEVAETVESTTTTTLLGAAAGTAATVGAESSTTTTLNTANGEVTTTTVPVTSTTMKVTAVAPAISTTSSTTTTLHVAATTAPTTTLRSAVAPSTTTTLKVGSAVLPTTTTVKLGTAAVTTTTLKTGMATTTTLRPGTVTTTTAKAAAPGAAPAVGIAGATAASTTTSTTLKPASLEVIVEALNRVNIRFSLNGGQKWESLELNPDQVHTFRSKTTIQLEVTDGGAVNVIVNGRDRGVPGTIGKPLKLNFP